MLSVRNAAYFFAFICAGMLKAQVANDLDESKAEFIGVPALIHQVDGKYPDSHIVLFRTDCGQDDKGAWKHQLAKGTYKVGFSGSGLSASNVTSDDCTVSFDLKTASTDHGAVVAQVSADGGPVGKGFLHFSDPLAGPTPGMPQVDVLWGPIGADVCNKAFGRSVSKKFYCIAVKIGNNSGYQLQIAGVGFRTGFGTANNTFQVKTPNSSYALTRAVAQEGLIDSPRSYFLHTIEAAGLIMASAAPYFHNQRSSSRFGTATSIVAGPLQAAFNLLWQDSSLRQANNLDDQSLRDGKLIPNNTQITTVVFLDKESVSLDFKVACDQLFGIEGTGHSAEVSSAKLKQDKDSATAKNYKNCVSGTTSSGLKRALGDLIIVGDTIQFLQRIVVDQTVHSQEVASVAQVGSVAVNYRTVSLAGKNLENLPGVLLIRAGGLTQSATRDPASTADAATYLLPRPFAASTAFTVQAVGTALPVSLTGNVQKSPDPGITGTPTLSGTKVTLAGKFLDVFPDPLLLTVAGATVTASRDSTSTDTAATYTLLSAPAVGAAFTIQAPTGNSITGNSSGTVTAP